MTGEFLNVGPTINDSERRAFELLKMVLEPAAERFDVYMNVRLPNGRGDFYEYDAVIVGEAIVFVIEVKGYGGRITCRRDRWYFEDGTSTENPSNRLSIKAKTLGSELLRRQRDLRGVLWVQDLVYVNGPAVRLSDVDYARRTSFDVNGTTFDASANGLFKEALLKTKRWNARSIPFEPQQREAILEYLRGGTRRVVEDRIGKYLIEDRLVAVSDRFERFIARDRYRAADDRRSRVELHVYPLDGRRETDERVARDFQRQIETVDHLGELGVVPRYIADDDAERAGRRIRYIAYESLASIETLGDRIARIGTPGLRDGLRLGLAVAESLASVHDQGLVHGALDPSSLYVRPSDAPELPPQIVIGRIELARPAESGASIASIGTIGGATSCYASPEILAGRRPTVDDDLFSFGAILAHVLRGRPIFASPTEILQRIKLPRLLDDRSADPPELQALVRGLLARTAASRPSSMRAAAAALRALLAPLEDRRRTRDRIGSYRILRELRSGATGRTVVAQRDDLEGEVVLKIAALSNDETVRREIECLRALQHPNVVVGFDIRVFDHEQVTVGEFALVPGEDGERMRGRVRGDQIATLVAGLFAALAAVHARGVLHRDVKPANVMIGPDGRATLLDFGLAGAPGDDDVIVGTAPYKSEALFARAAWAQGDDVFAATASLWEMITGIHPWNGVAPAGPPQVDAEALGALLPPGVAKAFAEIVRDLLENPPAADAATQAARRFARVLRAQEAATPTLPLAPPEIVLAAALRLADPLAKLGVAGPTRKALEALDVATVGEVRALRLADLSRVGAFGRGVAEEIQALGLALTARFGEPDPSSTSIMRSVKAAFAPLLAADVDALRDALPVLNLNAALLSALSVRNITTIAQLAGAEPGRFERDERIGPAGVAAIRTALRAYVEDRVGLIVDAALPTWRVAPRAAFVEAAGRLGADPAGAIDVLEAAGGFVLDAERLSLLRTPLAAAPQWREDDLVATLTHLRDTVTWPPRAIDETAEALIVHGREAEMPAFAAFGIDAARLFIERIVPHMTDLRMTSDGRLYRESARTLEAALVFGGDGVKLPCTLAEYSAAIEARLPGLRVPSAGAPEFTAALHSVGLAVLPDGRVERADAVARETEAPSPHSDVAGSDLVGLSDAARRIVAASKRGGYRLVTAEPGRYVMQVRALTDELRIAFGTRLQTVDFDAELLRALDAAGTLATALKVQAKRGPVVGAISPIAKLTAHRILDEMLAGVRDSCTLLVNAGGLTLADATQHLAKLYDEARGGAHGLIVVCVPGDHPREHARFNRLLPLPIQPTERPIALDAA